MNNYIGKIRLVTQPPNPAPSPYGEGWCEVIPMPPKLQQLDGKAWVEIEIVEFEDKVTI